MPTLYNAEKWFREFYHHVAQHFAHFQDQSLPVVTTLSPDLPFPYLYLEWSPDLICFDRLNGEVAFHLTEVYEKELPEGLCITTIRQLCSLPLVLTSGIASFKEIKVVRKVDSKKTKSLALYYQVSIKLLST